MKLPVPNDTLSTELAENLEGFNLEVDRVIDDAKSIENRVAKVLDSPAEVDPKKLCKLRDEIAVAQFQLSLDRLAIWEQREGLLVRLISESRAASKAARQDKADVREREIANAAAEGKSPETLPGFGLRGSAAQKGFEEAILKVSLPWKEARQRTDEADRYASKATAARQQQAAGLEEARIAVRKSLGVVGGAA